MIRRDLVHLRSPGGEMTPRVSTVARVCSGTEEDCATRVDLRHIRPRRTNAGLNEVERPETRGHATPDPQIKRANHPFELSPRCARFELRQHVGELLGSFQEPKLAPMTRHLVTETRDARQGRGDAGPEGRR